MKTPYLVQRVMHEGEVELPNSLIGNYSRPGRELTKEESRILNSVLSLDYMGSSEFEWGEFPKSMRRFAQVPDLVRFQLHLLRPVYVLAPKTYAPEIAKFFLSELEGTTRRRPKELTKIRESIMEEGMGYNRPQGWYDLDNLWFASLSAKQLDQVEQLLGLHYKPDTNFSVRAV